jgi:hypothetical protein
VGELVTDRLRRVDQVAYVRFASVYRQFKTLEDLVEEARAVLDARRYDVPGQGRLFIESSQANAAPRQGGEDEPAAKSERSTGVRPRAKAPKQPSIAAVE